MSAVFDELAPAVDGAHAPGQRGQRDQPGVPARPDAPDVPDAPDAPDAPVRGSGGGEMASTTATPCATCTTCTTCATCTHWQPRANKEMARHGLASCARRGACTFYPPSHSCARFSPAPPTVTQARADWLARLS